jgi:hypothetical protein
MRTPAGKKGTLREGGDPGACMTRRRIFHLTTRNLVLASSKNLLTDRYCVLWAMDCEG